MGAPDGRPTVGVSVLRAEGLRRRYGGRLVVDVDEIGVEEGEILAVLGPNGAGKSTLFRLLLLLEAPDEGRILLDGREVRRGDRDAARRIAGVFQRPFLFDGTVEENVAYGLRIRGLPAAERERRVSDTLATLGLNALARAPVQTLSGGEAQRVALARAVVLRPELLLLDEPTANLDVTVRRRFREDLERLVRSHARGALLITHDPADAFAIADRIAVMQEGRIVQMGRPEALVLEPATPFVAAFTGAELLVDGVVEGREEGLVTVRMRGSPAVVTAVDPAALPLRIGDAVQIAYRPEDLVLAHPEAAPETSARNRFRLRVAQLTASGGLVRVRLEGDVALAALVTRQAAEALDLAPGREVEVQVKATALRVFRSA